MTAPQLKAWEAHLNLVFSVAKDGTNDGGYRSFLRERQHRGPLLIQKTFHPEGAQYCHGIIVHPPGGVAGGDHLHLQVGLESNAKVLLTTPGAGKWYKALDLPAQQHLDFRLEENTLLEWLPQENILFDGVDVHFLNNVDLSASSTFVAWDIQCLGRQARAEKWQYGLLRQHTRITREGKPIWLDRTCLEPDSLVINSKTGLRGLPVFGLMLVAHPQAPDADLLAQCRQSKPAGTAICGLSALPAILAIRYVGDSAQQARHYFECVWQLLRPWYAGRAAMRPRIWNT